MNKQRVMALLKKQGAKVDLVRNGFGGTTVDAMLPQPLIWTSIEAGVTVFEQDPAYESMSEVWQAIWDDISGGVTDPSKPDEVEQPKQKQKQLGIKARVLALAATKSIEVDWREMRGDSASPPGMWGQAYINLPAGQLTAEGLTGYTLAFNGESYHQAWMEVQKQVKELIEEMADK